MSRAASPVVAIPLLVGITVILAAVLASGAFGFGVGPTPGEPVVLRATLTTGGYLQLVHEAGPTINVTEIDLRIAVDDEALDHQPPVPYRGGTEGFYGAATGPFNGDTDPLWEPGENAALDIAEDNAPTLTVGSHVVVGCSVTDCPSHAPRHASLSDFVGVTRVPWRV